MASPVDNQSRAPRPEPLRTRTLTIFLTVTAIVMSLGAVASVVPLPSGGLPSLLGRAEADRVSYASAPVQRWSAQAYDAGPGGRFVRPDPMSMEYLRPGVVEVDDVLITSIVTDVPERTASLVAYDHSGNRKWVTPVGSSPSCSSTSLDGALPCLSDGRLQMVNLSDGTIEQSTPIDFGNRMATVNGGVLVIDYRRSSAGSPENPTSTWDRTYTIEGDSGGVEDYCRGSGDSQTFGLIGEMAYFGTSLGQVVLDVDNGDILANGVAGTTQYPGRGIVGNTCQGKLVVLDVDGDRLDIDHTQAFGWTASVVRGDRTNDGRFFAGDSAFSFEDGRTEWSVAGASFDIVAGPVVIDRDDSSPTLTAYRRSTGDMLWSSSSGDPVVTDGTTMILANSGLTAIDLQTGSVAWTDASVDGNSVVDPVSGGLMASTMDTIRFLSAEEAADTEAGSVPSYESSDAVLTRCGQAPEMTPIEYRTDRNGLTVRMELRARCPSGDIIFTDALRVTLNDAGTPAASALFDLSSDPLYLPPTTGADGSVTVDFAFGPGTFYRMPNSLGTSDVPDGTVAKPTSRQEVDCYDEGTSNGPTSASATQVTKVVSTPVRSDRAAIPANVDPELLALNSLRAQARADMPYISDRLADRWVAQLSSKEPGLVAPDITGPDVTWDYQAILAQHLRLRLQYPEVRLVWSDDWSTFTLRGWWITVAGAMFSDADAANRWCDDRSIPTDECFAKIISNTRGTEGTTKYRR